jgi:hypothetical protein
MPRRNNPPSYSCAKCNRRFRTAHARHLHLQNAHRPPGDPRSTYRADWSAADADSRPSPANTPAPRKDHR